MALVNDKLKEIYILRSSAKQGNFHMECTGYIVWRVACRCK